MSKCSICDGWKKKDYDLFYLAVKELQSPEPDIRDSGGLTLADIDNPIAIPWIEEAIAREVNSILKRNLELVLKQLEETREQTDD